MLCRPVSAKLRNPQPPHPTKRQSQDTKKKKFPGTGNNGHLDTIFLVSKFMIKGLDDTESPVMESLVSFSFIFLLPFGNVSVLFT